MKFKILITFLILFFTKNTLSKEAEKIVEKNITLVVDNKKMNIDRARKYYKVPAVSIALINKNKIEWTYASGNKSASKNEKIDENTIFNFASMAKSISALVALKLVDKGVLKLDTDVNNELLSWKISIPEKFKGNFVTLRSLLNMTSGLGVSGFYGYAPEEKTPTLLETLNGKFPANNNAVLLEKKPGSEFSYSGGGYEVLELLIESVTKKSFREVAKNEVLQPLNLKNTSFSFSLEKNFNIAESTDKEGNSFSYPWRKSPELAAAGLWTTPTDFAKVLIELMRSYNNEKSLFSKSLTKEAFKKNKHTPYGFGFVLMGKDKNFHIMKLGQNAGYQGWFIAYPETGQGAVVITNSDNGRELAQDIIYSLAKKYAWPTDGKLLDVWMLTQNLSKVSDN
ncbi:serine hydrolase domain-containing protein [Fluviispira vulneris]|uniref:serine hydrolase domain-containing protein n=1 Tax=Fluviispira vulneris TaxID=2763012 RepID=UPI001648E461|nr:serine hydrolase domain-containing protein [Fluviispira vulneris]